MFLCASLAPRAREHDVEEKEWAEEPPACRGDAQGSYFRLTRRVEKSPRGRMHFAGGETLAAASSPAAAATLLRAKRKVKKLETRISRCGAQRRSESEVGRQSAGYARGAAEGKVRAAGRDRASGKNKCPMGRWWRDARILAVAEDLIQQPEAGEWQRRLFE